MKNILVPIDFTDVSLKGLEVAANIAERTNGRLILFNCIHRVGASGFSTMGGGSSVISTADRFVAEYYRKIRANLSQLAGTYRQKNLQVQVAIVIGDFRAQIKRFIHKHAIDMVVMGTSGENDFSEIWMGNHTEQVIRGTNCPVIAVHEKQQKFESRKVLLTLDEQAINKGKEQLQLLCQLLNFLEANVHVLKAAAGSDTKSEQQKLEKELKAFGLNKCSVEVKKLPDFLKAVIASGNDRKVDLIASVRKAKNGWTRSIRRSVNENLIRKSQIPVLSVELR